MPIFWRVLTKIIYNNGILKTVEYYLKNYLGEFGRPTLLERAIVYYRCFKLTKHFEWDLLPTQFWTFCKCLKYNHKKVYINEHKIYCQGLFPLHLTEFLYRCNLRFLFKKIKNNKIIIMIPSNFIFTYCFLLHFFFFFLIPSN